MGSTSGLSSMIVGMGISYIREMAYSVSPRCTSCVVCDLRDLRSEACAVAFAGTGMRRVSPSRRALAAEGLWVMMSVASTPYVVASAASESPVLTMCTKYFVPLM